MRRRLLVVALLLVGAAMAISQGRPIIAVLDFRVSSVSEADMRAVTSLLTASLFKSGRYTVIDVSQRETLLAEVGFSAGDCSDEKCQLQVGKLLSAEQIVVGDLAKVGARYVVTAKILETQTAKTLSVADGVYGSLDALVDDVQSLSRRLAGLQGEEGRPSPGDVASKAAPAEMVLVEGGTFQMGDTFGAGGAEEWPFHTVTVSSFTIGKYEVTQKEWVAVMGANPSNLRGDNLPVALVSWFDVVDFCNRLSDKEGLQPCYTINGSSVSCDFSTNGYRLPTEAEWEYAATGGRSSRGYKYAGGNDVDTVGWYEGNSGKSPHPVGGKKANELGLYDMSGNVWEWCWDSYGSYSAGSQTDPRGPSWGQNRLMRGGAWGNTGSWLRAAHRSGVERGFRSDDVGFRLARSRT